MYKFLIAALFVLAGTAYAGCGACGEDDPNHTHEDGHSHEHECSAEQKAECGEKKDCDCKKSSKAEDKE